MAESASLTVYPGAYDASASSIKTVLDATNHVGMGSSNTTAKYTAFYTNTGNGTTSYVYIPFDLSPIPDNADIDSVACTARARVNVTSGWSAGAAQLFTGNTAKGSSRALLYAAGANSSSLITLSPGTWTREELKNCRLRLSCTRSTNSTSNICIFFYGADLTVTYTYQSEKFMLKLGGSWTDVARVFKKVSGIWVEQTVLANVVDQTKRLVNGGWVESSFINFTIVGTNYRAEKGMTWGEWCDSDYNTGMYSVVASDYIMNPSLKAVCTSAGDKVVSTTVIVSGHAYIYG